MATSPPDQLLPSVQASILQVVRDAPSRSIRGTDLAQAVRRDHPAFQPITFNCMNLREFIDRYVPAVARVGRAGMDHVYGLREGNPTPSQVGDHGEVFSPDEEVVNADLIKWWRTFASPNGTHRLLANRTTGERMALGAGVEMPGEPWVVVPPCTLGFFAEVAKDFTTSLKDDFSRNLVQGVVQMGTGLDSDFYQTLLKLGLREPWNAFRRRRIISRFVSTLNELGIPLRPATSVAPPKPSSVRPNTSTLAPVASSHFDSLLTGNRGQPPAIHRLTPELREARLRRIAITTVSRMSVRDLHELHLPLGDVLDALDEGNPGS